MPGGADGRGGGEPGALAARNRRTALALVGWIVLLCLASVIVVWVRN